MKRSSLDYLTSSASKLFRLRSNSSAKGSSGGECTEESTTTETTTTSVSAVSSNVSGLIIKERTTLEVLRQSQHLGHGPHSNNDLRNALSSPSNIRCIRTDSVTDSSDTEESEEGGTDDDASSALSIVFDGEHNGSPILSSIPRDRRVSPDWYSFSAACSASSTSTGRITTKIQSNDLSSVFSEEPTPIGRARSKSALPSSFREKPSSMRRTTPRPRRTSVSDSIRASITKTRLGLPKVKQKGQLLRCENVVRWCEMEQHTRKRCPKSPTIVWVRRVSKVSVAFNYVSLLKHHFIILELYQGPKKVGYLASQIVNNGDITMYVYSDWKSAIRHGQCGASFGGKPSEKQGSVVKTSGVIHEVSLNDFARFMEESVPKEYNLITHNCLVVSEAIYKHLSAFEH